MVERLATLEAEQRQHEEDVTEATRRRIDALAQREAAWWVPVGQGGDGGGARGGDGGAHGSAATRTATSPAVSRFHLFARSRLVGLPSRPFPRARIRPAPTLPLAVDTTAASALELLTPGLMRSLGSLGSLDSLIRWLKKRPTRRSG